MQHFGPSFRWQVIHHYDELQKLKRAILVAEDALCYCGNDLLVVWVLHMVADAFAEPTQIVLWEVAGEGQLFQRPHCFDQGRFIQRSIGEQERCQ